MEAKPKKIKVLDIDLDRWTHKSSIAEFGVGYDEDGKWATLYSITSGEQGQGHATELLIKAKAFYERYGYKVGSTMALNDRMRGILRRTKIEEYIE